VSHHPEHEGGLVQGEGAELHPQVDDVVRQPGQAEDHDHHQDRLGRLRRERSVVVIVNSNCHEKIKSCNLIRYFVGNYHNYDVLFVLWPKNMFIEVTVTFDLLPIHFN